MFIHDIPFEWAFEFPRQVGKTETIADWIAFMFLIGAELLDKPFKCIIFAPTKSQASQDYSRFRSLLSLWAKNGHEVELLENTKSKIESVRGDKVVILPLSKKGDIVGETGNFLIFEEAQDLDDNMVENKAIPMGANFATPAIFIGTAGTQLCKFYSLILLDMCVRFSCWQIIDMKRMQYERDKNTNHLNYEKNIIINQQTMTEDNFGRQFNNLWLLGENQFMLAGRYDELSRGSTEKRWDDEPVRIYSLDLARKYDGCILSYVEYIPRINKIEVYPSTQLPSGSYADHYQYIKQYMSGKKYDYFVCDVTGNQHVLPDLLTKDGIIDISKYIPFVFTQSSKHEAFSMLANSIRNSDISFVGYDEQMRYELSLLVKKYNSNGTISVSTPERKGWHDDRPCALAMAIHTIYSNVLTERTRFYTI